MVDFLVLGRQEIEPQPIVEATVDRVALPLPSDECEVEALGHPGGLIVLDDPGMHGMEAEISKGEGEHL
jgi:hypothetical protein